MSRYLTEASYANTPPLLGEVVRRDNDDVPHTLMLMQGFVRNQGDAWNWTLAYLARAVEDLTITDTTPDQVDDSFVAYRSFAGTIGSRLAELHSVLSAETDNAAFAPEPVTPKDASAWKTKADDLDRKLAGAGGQIKELSADLKKAQGMAADSAARVSAVVRERQRVSGALRPALQPRSRMQRS